jgi:ATP-binding cassette, subfamily B, bacterial AbcA/BmrA
MITYIGDKRMLKKQTDGDLFSFIYLIKETNPSKSKLSCAILMSTIMTIVGLFIPLFTKKLVDHFSIHSFNQNTIMILVSAFLAQAIAGGLSIYLLNYVGQEVVANMREQLLAKFLHFPIAYFDNHQTGEMTSRIINDTAIVKNLISNHLTSFATGVISITGSIVILLIIDWKMTMIMLCAVPLSLCILLPLGKKMVRVSRGTQDETAQFSARVTQVLSEIRLVKSSNAEPLEYRNGIKGIQNLFQLGVKEGKIQAFTAPLISLIMMALLVVIIGYGGMRVSSGALSAGELVAFILYLIQIIMPMAQFSTFFTQLQKAKGATERIINALHSKEEDHQSGTTLNKATKSLIIKDLTFAYEENKPVLQHLNFTADGGKITAIVGPSGGGKTTFFSLLERYYRPSHGEIRLGDLSICSFSLSSWRSQIGYVSQESPLISGTIRENICYGLQGNVSEEELHHAAKLAYAHQFILQFPNGYETEVGERGIKLSGGQRQRIGIARALLRNPHILMLDEATSSLDSKSEIYVQKALKNLMHGRTTLVIAHRLSTVIDADKILFMENGRITGQGTHDELLASHDLYREFAVEQLQLSKHHPTESLYIEKTSPVL